MARLSFRSDFVNLTARDKFTLDALLSVYELILKKSFFKRMALTTHRFSKIKRMAFFRNAIKAVKRKGMGSDNCSNAFWILANDCEIIINNHSKK